VIAITRGVSRALVACELTHLERQAIDVELAKKQHRAYEAALRDAGCDVRPLPADDALADCVFVEDVAIVLDDVAILTRTATRSRRAETPAIAEALAPFRPLRSIEAPGTLDGGDVLRVDQTLYVGKTTRTNTAGIEQLAALARGHRVVAVDVDGCLHLKSAVTQIGPNLLLVNPRFVRPFSEHDRIAIDPSEPAAANGLWIGSKLLYPASFPKTRRILEERGVAIVPLDLSELQKAEGAVTCCSLLFTANGAP
jgi:dimethylargininase